MIVDTGCAEGSPTGNLFFLVICEEVSMGLGDVVGWLGGMDASD